jgi:hypothetical protein
MTGHFSDARLGAREYMSAGLTSLQILEATSHHQIRIAKKHVSPVEQSSIAGVSRVQSPRIELRDPTRGTHINRRPSLMLHPRPPPFRGLLYDGLFLNENPPTQPELRACRYSDQLYNGDLSLMQTFKAPTRFMLMTSRYVYRGVDLVVARLAAYFCRTRGSLA